MKMLKFMDLRRKNGITLIALIVTIVVLLILAGISIASLTGNNGIVKNATEAQIQTALSEVREQLDLYKIKGEGDRIRNGDYSGEMSNQELVGTIYSEAFMNDTYRNVGIIKASGIKDELKCGTKLGKSRQEDSVQNQIDANEGTVTLDNIYQLYDAFVVDFADDTLYYVKNNQIWSIEGTKTDYTLADGSITQNYPIEQVDQAYLEKRKFITEWQVATGEQVVLPITQNVNRSYNCTIEWGDGTTTLLQDNVTVDGEKKTNYVEVDGQVQTISSLSEAVTHTYTTDSANNIREIKISGIYESFWAKDKTQLIDIKQWGNVGFEDVNFANCSNLTGTIPETKGMKPFEKPSSLYMLFSNCSQLTGNIPEDLFEGAKNISILYGGGWSTFQKCSNLTGEIPENLFKDCINLTNVWGVFDGCSKLTGTIPENLFSNCKEITNFNCAFRGCIGLEGEIPENLFANNAKANSFDGVFAGCSGLTGKIPEKLFWNAQPNAYFGSNWNGAFMGCSGLTEIPENLFIKQTECTSIGACFCDCKQITNIPENLFADNTKVTNFARTFKATGISSIPENLFANCTEVTSFVGTFSGTKITDIPVNLFKNNTKVTNFAECFNSSSIIKVPSGLFDNNTVVTNMAATFARCANLVTVEEGFKLPESVTCVGGQWSWNGLFGEDYNLTTIPENFVIGENVTDMRNAFAGCHNLKGSILIKANAEKYTDMLKNTSINSSGTLTINYSSNCTNIDDLIATNNTGKVVKGSLVE